MSEDTTTATATQTSTDTSAPSDSLLSGVGDKPPAQTQINGAWKGFAGEDGTFAPDWYKHLPEEMGADRDGLSKFKTFSELSRGYVELNKALGRKANHVPLPTDKSTPEEIAAYRKAIGIPETPDKYDVKPDKLPDGMTWDDNFAKQFADIAHKNNVPPAAMKALVNQYAQLEAQKGEALIQHAIAEKQSNIKKLQTLWDSNFEKNLTRASQTAKMVGADPDSIGFGDPEVVKAFYELSKKLSDDQFVMADGTPMNYSGQAAARDIMTNKSNPKYERYQAGDPDVVAEVRRGLEAKN